MDVKIGGTGSGVDTFAQVDPTYDALRVSYKPEEFANAGTIKGGHYSVGCMTGLIAAGIASLSQVFQVAWLDTSKLFLLKKLVVQCSTATGFAATTLGAPLELIVGHGATSVGAGGTALTVNSASNRLRGDTMSASALVSSGEIRVATTAALTPATGQALEANPIGSCMGADNRTLVSTPQMVLFEQRDFGTHPLVLNTGDTLAVRTNSAAATGTWYACFTMEWLETPNNN